MNFIKWLGVRVPEWVEQRIFSEDATPAKTPLNNWQYIANARYKEHTDCLNYLLERGCPEPTDEEYANFFEHVRALESQEENSLH